MFLPHLIIATYALGLNCFNRFKKKAAENHGKNALIIFQQIMGDAVMFSASLDAYVRLFSSQEGWTLRMICRPSVARFMREVVPIPDGLQIEAVDFTRLICDFKYFKEITRKYGDWSSMTIVPGTSLSAELLSAALPVERRIGLLPAVSRTRFSPFWLLQKMAYSETVRPKGNPMVLQAQRVLLHYLGASDYRAALPRLLRKDRIVEGRYAVVCPGTSIPVKSWPHESFARVIDELNGRFNLDVHLCGDAGERPIGEKIRAEVHDPDRVINHIGQTTFSQWSALIQHASLVLGNDSATAHIAAAARVPTVCIVGRYDLGHCFPYAVDALKDTDRLPDIVMWEENGCSLCRTKGYRFGYRNRECKKRIVADQCAICIDAITVEEVMRHVSRLLENRT